MLPDNLDPGSPEEWLRYALSDLELARVASSPNILLATLCFHAQQVAEKSLKAVLIAHVIPVPRIHNIDILLDLLPQDIELPEELQEARKLTAYAVIARYPSNLEPIEQQEYEVVLQLAEKVFVWAQTILQRPRPTNQAN